MYLNIFLIGPSGSGKSTQARMIADKYGLTHFSAGQLLRDEINTGSKLGLEAKDYVDKGLWVPNHIILTILESHIDRIGDQNFIIDGFPRILEQGIELAKYLKKVNRPTTCLIHLTVSFQEIMNRRKAVEVSGQRFSDEGRTDETPESIINRQKSYDDTINPILDHFKNDHLLVEIDGNRAVSPIFSDICQEIDKIVAVNNIKTKHKQN